MCGIFALIENTVNTPNENDPNTKNLITDNYKDLITSTTTLLNHRGPDSHGNKLIIDPQSNKSLLMLQTRLKINGDNVISNNEIKFLGNSVKIKGINFSTQEDQDIRVSGALEKHYAPNAKVLINQSPIKGQALMALSAFETPEGVYRISSPENVSDFARLLYSSLRRADELGFDVIVVLIPEGQGMEIALLDRVSKASNGL